MKLKEMLKEDMNKFSNQDLLTAYARFLKNELDNLMGYELIKLIKEFRKRNLNIQYETDEYCDLLGL